MTAALRISLAANVVLLGVAGWSFWRMPAPAPPAASLPPAGRPAPVAIESRPAAPPLSPAPPGEGEGGTLNPAALARLEQLGLPRDVVVNAFIEKFHRHWDEQFTELQRRYAPKEVPERVMLELSRRRDEEKIRELKDVMGEAGYLAWDREQTLRQLNTAGVPLSANEADQAYRMQKEFEALHRELQMAMEDGVADRADVGELQRRVEEALDGQLEQLFGREKLNAMRGVTDPVAGAYRAYADLDPTEDQAQAALALDETFQAQEKALATRAGDPAQLAGELRAIQRAREEELRRIFGAEAYDDQKRRNDPTYRTLALYAEVWSLQAQDVRSVYVTLSAFHDEADRLRQAAQISESAGRRVDWTAVEAAVGQARQRTEAGLQAVVGSERLDRLKRNGLLMMR